MQRSQRSHFEDDSSRSQRKRKRSPDSPSGSRWPHLEDALVPFRNFVQPESSTFEVSVPSRYLDGDRKFQFENLTLSPHLFSREAAGFNVEADEEGLAVIKCGIRLDAEFGGVDKKLNFTPPFRAATLMTAGKYIQEFNAFFEREKPDFVRRCPLFFDWTHLDLESDEDFAGDYYGEAEIFDQTWFNEEFSPDIHGNGLPASLEKLKGVNHLKYPAAGAFSESETNAANFRVRLWLAPFVKATFSSPGILLDLGFTASQFGEQTAKQQITVVNSEAAFVEFTGLTAPKIDLTSKCTVNLYPAELLATSFVHLLEISAKDYRNHAFLAKMLNAKIQDCANELNVNVSLQFDESERKFQFAFPSSSQILLSLFFQKPELSLRMGYFYTNVIDKNSAAREVRDVQAANVADAFKKCAALCFDTGIVLCTLDQLSSNTTSGALDFYMASLFPRPSGVMELDRCGQDVPPGVILTPSSGSSSATVPFKFRLLRIYDNQEIRAFAWNDGAWIYGMLRGIRVRRSDYD